MLSKEERKIRMYERRAAKYAREAEESERRAAKYARDAEDYQAKAAKEDNSKKKTKFQAKADSLKA